MINQNHISHIPWAILLLVLICIILGSGVLLGGREVLNPQSAAQSAHSTATFDFLAYQATQGALQATGQALQAVQNRDHLAAVATQIPLEITVNAAQAQATQNALLIQSSATQAVIKAQATQTAIQLMVNQDQIRFQVEQTSVARQAEEEEQQRELDRATQVAMVGIAAVLGIGMAGLMVGLGITIVNNSRRKEGAIVAQAIREERRLIELRSALRPQASSNDLYTSNEPKQPTRPGGNGNSPTEVTSLMTMNTTVHPYRKHSKVDDLPTAGD